MITKDTLKLQEPLGEFSLEKTKMEVTVTRRFEEAYLPWAVGAIICVVFELLIGLFLGRIIL